MASIPIKNVRKSYGKDEVVHGVNLEIANGEFVVILGPSGCVGFGDWAPDPWQMGSNFFRGGKSARTGCQGVSRENEWPCQETCILRVSAGSENSPGDCFPGEWRAVPKQAAMVFASKKA